MSFHNFNFRVTGRIRTDVNNIHSVAPKPLGHSHHIFERHGRIGLPSPAWQAGIITTIRMPQNFYNHRLVEHPRLTILSSKTTTIFIILYPRKNSNPHQQIRGLVCCPLHHKGIWSRVVESDHSNWFCRPGPNRSANPTLFVEISGLEPELREPKSLVLPLHHISISKQE